MPPFSGGAVQHRPLVLAIFVLLIAGELAWLAWHRRAGYDWRETLASTAIAIGNMLIRPLNLLLLTPLFAFVYAHRLFDLQVSGPLRFAALLIAVDFVYYWFHRASHHLRWMWATHAVHHSSTQLNLSAAYRLGWTELLSGSWLFLLLPVWLGVAPLLVVGAFGLNLVYQFALHSRVIGRLGWIEWIFNTPAHHRVHHAANPQLLDRNFGGILIVWDRMFGTFAEQGEASLRYGVLGREPSYNPLAIVGREWRAMFVDWRRAHGWRARWRALI